MLIRKARLIESWQVFWLIVKQAPTYNLWVFLETRLIWLYILLGKVYVCIIDGKIIGCIICGIGCNRIGYLSVDREYRHQGIGDRLIAVAERRMFKSHKQIEINAIDYMILHYLELGYTFPRTTRMCKKR